MHRATHALMGVLSLGLFLGLAATPALAHQDLPHLKPIPNPKCYTLTHSHGDRYAKHLLWHLTRKGPAKDQYKRMYVTISDESGWDAGAKNKTSTASGFAQFLSSWWARRWHWNPFNGPLNIRVFVYCIEHPRETGGWSNWAGH